MHLSVLLLYSQYLKQRKCPANIHEWVYVIQNLEYSRLSIVDSYQRYHQPAWSLSSPPSSLSSPGHKNTLGHLRGICSQCMNTWPSSSSTSGALSSQMGLFLFTHGHKRSTLLYWYYIVVTPGKSIFMPKKPDSIPRFTQNLLEYWILSSSIESLVHYLLCGIRSLTNFHGFTYEVKK